MINLENKTAVVTGAARGLGKGIAIKLAELNAHVVVSDLHEEEAEKTVETIRERGGEASSYLCNVADAKQAAEMIENTIYTHNQIDILVNNAGINRDGMLHKMTEEQWQQVLDVNLTGVFNTLKPASKHMRERQKGRIINISSASWLGNIGQANYAASKAGVVGLTKTASRELAKKNVTVNAICPGFIDTDMTRSMPEKAWEIMVEKVPMRKPGEPEDVANCIAFLSSDQAGYITGEVINVGGGMIL